MRARERIAAERAAQKRAEARRRFLVPIAAVTTVLAIVGALVAVKLSSAPATAASASESPASSVVVRQVTTVPAAVLTRVNPGQAATPLQTVKAAGPPLTIGGKPAIVFVSEESCPFCAAERWPLTVALAHFGTWSQLGSTRSSATDIYPNTATLSFRTAQYRSAELTLRTTELADNAGRPLQAQTPLDTKLIGTYDVPSPDRQPAQQPIEPGRAGSRRIRQGDHHGHRPGPARPGGSQLALAAGGFTAVPRSLGRATPGHRDAGLS
jgi:hypothetical protein